MRNDEFYVWMDRCPVQWFLLDSDNEQMSVQFIVPDDEEEETEDA